MDYRDYPALVPVIEQLVERWPDLFREAVQSLDLFAPSPEIHIQDPDDIRLFILPLKWQGAMADQHLCNGGQILDSVPTTAGLVDRPLIVSALFSMSMPGCEITPHIDNESWIGDVWRVHIGLSCPADCALIVDGDSRGWSDGEVLMFDSARVEHSAYNHSAQPRLVLILDVDRKALAA
ncbi:Aspartyl/Asparaginyl beta-hydroxylase [compost metagenome]